MAAVAVIARPAAEGTRQALVLTEDRLGHYPEFRDFFVRTFDLDRVGLSEPGFVQRAFGRRLRFGVRGAKRRAVPLGARGLRHRRSAGASRRRSSRQGPVGDSRLDDHGRRSAVDGGGPSRDRPAVPDSGGGMRSTLLDWEYSTWNSLTRR